MLDEASPGTLVLLPGMDGTGALFADFIAARPAVKSTEFALLILDYPVDVALGYDELVQLVRAHLPQDRPYLLLAESFSGPVGLMLAAASPPGMRGLVLCCTFAKNPSPSLALFKPCIALLGFAGSPTVLSHLGHRALFGRFASARTKQALSNALRRLHPRVLQSRMRAVLEVDTTALLSQVTLPVLYLSAQEDRVVPRSSCDYLQRHLPQMNVARFAAPHMLLQTAAPEVWPALTAFAESLAEGNQEAN